MSYEDIGKESNNWSERIKKELKAADYGVILFIEKFN